MIINLIMALILIASVFLTGGLGLGIIFTMEYLKKKRIQDQKMSYCSLF